MAVFLDRDGTINEDVNYLSSPDQLVLLPTVLEAMKIFQRAGYLIVIVSNQSGVARGFFEEEKLREINKKLEDMIQEAGVVIAGNYYCPHHYEEGIVKYRQKCDCRKPQIGMIKKAAMELDIDLSSSALIGDKVTDIETAINAKIPHRILVKTGKGEIEARRLSKSMDAKVCDTLLEAAEMITEGKVVM